MLSSLKPFIPVVSFVPVSFLLLAALNEVIETAPDLSPWLYLASAASWVIAFIGAAFLFSPVLLRRRLGFSGTVLLAIVAIAIYYPCFGYLVAHAEQHVAERRIFTGHPPDFAFDAMYHESSGRGAAHATELALEMLKAGFGLYVFFWLPVVLIAARRVNRPSLPTPNTA